MGKNVSMKSATRRSVETEYKPKEETKAAPKLQRQGASSDVQEMKKELKSVKSGLDKRSITFRLSSQELKTLQEFSKKTGESATVIFRSILSNLEHAYDASKVDELIVKEAALKAKKKLLERSISASTM